jgi:RNA exonuclease 4
MAVLSTANGSSSPEADGGFKKNYSTNYNRNSHYDRSHNSYHKNSRDDMSSSSYSDYSESSESSCDSVDSIISTDSTNNRRQRKSIKNKSHNGSFAHAYKKPEMPCRDLYVAMDCEMVATASGRVCARVVLVDWKSQTLLDTHVKPDEPVTDYLTFVSGITADDLVDAPDFATVRAEVQKILAGNILIGHGLENDLACLKMEHPWWMTRDTAYYQPYMQLRDCGGNSLYVPRKLKDLCKEKLSKEIQVLGESHCPFEDAKAALDLYKSHRPRWEICVTTQIRQQRKLARQQQMAHQQQMAYYYATAPTASVAN